MEGGEITKRKREDDRRKEGMRDECVTLHRTQYMNKD